jgi:exopolysaccharide production protein ExoZ
MIANLQTLRAFAALNVVLLHIIGIAATYSHPTFLLSVLEGWGGNGVDIFFVISGFVMLYTQLTRKRQFSSFIKSRIVRIVPLYWLLTTLLAVTYLVLPSAFREMAITPGWAAASYFFMSAVSQGHELQGKIPIIGVGWTLEWEMLFYFAFGLSLYFRNWAASLAFTLLVLSAVAIVSSNPIIFEFFAGMLLAIVYQKNYISQRVGGWLLLFGCGLLALSLAEFVHDLNLNRVIVWGIPSILIVIGTVTSKPITNRILLFLGNASYSIYLVQMFCMPVFYKVVRYLGFELNGDLLAILCLTFTAITGGFLYKFIETPMTNFLRKKII